MHIFKSNTNIFHSEYKRDFPGLGNMKEERKYSHLVLNVKLFKAILRTVLPKLP